MSDSRYEHRSATVSDLVSRLATDGHIPEDPIFIPSLQREFTWDHDQIVDLFDSLLTGLPLNALLLWNVSGQTAEEEATYEFIRNYAEKSAYPTKEKCEKDSVWVRNKSRKLESSEGVPAEYTFALDGQQRLTSFLIGLTGTHYRYKSQRWQSKLSSYTRRELFIDLLNSPCDRGDLDEEPRYRFSFQTSGQNRTERDNYWWPVPRILSIDDLDDEIERVEPIAKSPEERELINHNLTRLFEAIHEEDHIVIEHVSDMDSRMALQLFVRRNAGGDPLSNSDIAFSQMAVYWTSEEQDPKEALESYVDELEQEFGDYGFGFGKGYIIRSLLMMAGHPPSFRREYLIAKNIRDLEDVWLNPAYHASMTEAYRIVTKELGLGYSCVTSNSAILPIVYYCYQNLSDGSGGAANPPREILKKMEYWLAVTVCNNLFSLGSDTVLRRAQDYVTGEDFPVLQILEEFRGRGLELVLDLDRLKVLVDETDYHSGTVKHLLLTKAYPDDRISGKLHETVTDDGDVQTQQMQVDHIFPLNKLHPEDEEELHERGLSHRDVENRHRLGNLQLIPENQSKGDKDPAEWLDDPAIRGDMTLSEFTEMHCLPWEDPEAYRYDRFSEFCEARERILLDRLTQQMSLHEEVR